MGRLLTNVNGFGLQALLCPSLVSANQGTWFSWPSVGRKGFGLWFGPISLTGMLLKGFWMGFFSLKSKKKTLDGNLSSPYSDAACEEVMAGASAALLCLEEVSLKTEADVWEVEESWVFTGAESP